MKRTCNVCEDNLDIEDFRLTSYVPKSGIRARDTTCKACRLDTARAQREAAKKLDSTEFRDTWSKELVLAQQKRIDEVKKILKVHGKTLGVSCVVADEILEGELV